MLEITLNRKPDPEALTQLIQVAMQEQRSLESVLDEVSTQYLGNSKKIKPPKRS